jgi:hypothetical protein
MKRREALSLIAGSALAILPLSVSSANPKRKTIYCMKNGKVRKVRGANPSCPVGWKKTSAKQGKAALKAQKDAKKKSSNSASESINPATEPTKPSTTPGVPNNWIKLTALAALPNAGFYCPGHGATYDQNGQNPTNPAPAALARKKFEVVNGDVYLLP